MIDIIDIKKFVGKRVHVFTVDSRFNDQGILQIDEGRNMIYMQMDSFGEWEQVYIAIDKIVAIAVMRDPR